MALEHVKMNDIVVFGWTNPVKDCWWSLANETISTGWKNLKAEQFLQSFTKNIDICYSTLFRAELTDLDSDRTYSVFFSNEQKLWDVKNLGNEAVQVTGDERKEIFTSSLFKLTCKRTAQILKQRQQTLEQVVEPNLTDPRLVEVDSTKLEAIDHFLRDELLMKNLLRGKYLKAIE